MQREVEFRRLAPSVIAAFSAAMLAGWLGGIQSLQFIAGWGSMKANTALALLLTAGALLSAGPQGQPAPPPGRRLSPALGLAAALLALATFLQYPLGLDFGIDQLLAPDPTVPALAGHPGRMAPLTALSLASLAAAVSLAGWRGPAAAGAAQALGLAAACVAGFSVLEFSFGAAQLESKSIVTRMSLQTSLAILALGLSLLMAQPGGLLPEFLRSSRRWGPAYAPALVAVPLLLGGLRLLGQRAGWYGTESGLALMTGLTIAALVLSSLHVARRLEREERQGREARAETARQERFFSALLDAAPASIYAKDRQRRFLYVNRTYEAAAGRDRSQVLGRTADGMWAPEVVARHEAGVAEVFESGQARSAEISAVHQGELHHHLAQRFPLFDEQGFPYAVGSITTDITQRKRLEEELGKALAQARQANEGLEAFSYSVSHDLRAPLRSVSGFSRILLEDHAGGLDGQGRDLCRRMQAAAERMGSLIDGLLSLSRLSRQELELREADLSAMAGEIAGELQGRDPGRQADFEVAPGLRARGDAGLLRAALHNLMENAWKFTAKAPRARIAFGRESRGGGEAFFVRDNGAGFDMAYADKLFGAFQRLHPESEFAGSGIGLATVKRIVQRHGGSIWAESGPGLGAAFFFTLGG